MNFFYIRLDTCLAKILGFDFNYITEIAKNKFSNYMEILRNQLKLDNMPPPQHFIKANRPYDIGSGIEHIYITCDVIKNNHYNNVLTDILRVIHIPKNIKFGENIHYIFEKPYYFPLKNNKFDRIGYRIWSDIKCKNSLKFTDGEIFLNINIRKCNKKIIIPLEALNQDDNIKINTVKPVDDKITEKKNEEPIVETKTDETKNTDIKANDDDEHENPWNSDED